MVNKVLLHFEINDIYMYISKLGILKQFISYWMLRYQQISS